MQTVEPIANSSTTTFHGRLCLGTCTVSYSGHGIAEQRKPVMTASPISHGDKISLARVGEFGPKYRTLLRTSGCLQLLVYIFHGAYIDGRVCHCAHTEPSEPPFS